MFHVSTAKYFMDIHAKNHQKKQIRLKKSNTMNLADIQSDDKLEKLDSRRNQSQFLKFKF